MPELPDLVHIVRQLGPGVKDRHIRGARVSEPIVLRIFETGKLTDLVSGEVVGLLERHGPFLRFELSRHDLVMHLMLAGRLKLCAPSDKRLPHEAFALEFADGDSLSYGDEKNMGRVYLCPKGDYSGVPGYLGQGVDVTSPAFTWEIFSALIAKKRNQARVFIMDQSSISAIGNAYADEILFEAGIHPKTPCHSLDPPARRRLFEAINSILAWGTEEVEKAGRPLEEKVRGHLRVRNKAGESCPRCGSTIRKAGVLGFDSFFCPRCQPDQTGRGLDWNRLPSGLPQ
jgi:formamidopyrimidine-DNA glycosylase